MRQRESPLHKLVESVLQYHTLELEPVKRRVTRKQSAFNFLGSKNHVSMGDFYELVTAGFYGGKVRKYIQTEAQNGDDRTSQLDVITTNGFGELELVHESKACCSGQRCNLWDYQVYSYCDIQRRYPDAKIWFDIYRHELHKIKSFKGTEDELFNALTNKTAFLVSLPLSLVDALNRNSAGNQEIVYRYEGGATHNVSALRSNILNKFLTNPEEVITQMGLNLGDYEIQRKISSSNFCIEGIQVKQFPIVLIDDKYHQEWVERFLDEKPLTPEEIKDLDEDLVTLDTNDEIPF